MKLEIGTHDFNLEDIWHEVRTYLEDGDYDYIVDQLKLLRREFNRLIPLINTKSFRFAVIKKNLDDQFNQKQLQGSCFDFFKDEISLLIQSIEYFKQKNDNLEIPNNRLEFVEINSSETNSPNDSEELAEAIAPTQKLEQTIYGVFSQIYNSNVESILESNDIDWLTKRVEEYFNAPFQFPEDNYCITKVRAPKSFLRAFFYQINKEKRPDKTDYLKNYIPFIKSCFVIFHDDSEDNIKKNFKRGLPELIKIWNSLTNENTQNY